MIRLVNQIVINKPIELVYSFLSDFESIPLWNYYVKEVTKIPVNNGSRIKYRQIRKSDSQVFEILDKQFPTRLEIASTGENNIKFTRRFMFASDPSNNCILEDLFEIESGHAQVLQQLFKGKMKNAVKENLQKLKELLELGHTVLQDGRVSNVTI